MNEEEVKTKWCPFFRHGNAIGGTSNRDELGYFDHNTVCNCIGSGCMAWRTEKNTEPLSKMGEGSAYEYICRELPANSNGCSIRARSLVRDFFANATLRDMCDLVSTEKGRASLLIYPNIGRKSVRFLVDFLRTIPTEKEKISGYCGLAGKE